MNQKTSSKKLLIIEDDEQNLKFLVAYLSRYFSITTCDSDIAFYEKIKEDVYNLILMDISIKGVKNGLDLTRELKSNPEYSNIPVIFYTAHALHKDRVNAMEAGCDLFLSKPIDNNTLLNSLLSFLEKRDLSLERNKKPGL